MSALSPPDTSTPNNAFSREASVDSAAASARGTVGPGSIISAKSGATGLGGKRKKGGKRGTRTGTAAASEINGETGEDGEQVVYMEDMPEDKDEDDADLAAASQLATLEGGQMSEAQKKQEKKHLQQVRPKNQTILTCAECYWKDLAMLKWTDMFCGNDSKSTRHTFEG
jgi:hypothetical protein